MSRPNAQTGGFAHGFMRSIRRVLKGLSVALAGPLAAAFFLMVFSVEAAPVLVSRDADGAAGSSDSGALSNMGVFMRPTITDTGGVAFISAAALSPEDTHAGTDPYVLSADVAHPSPVHVDPGMFGPEDCMLHAADATLRKHFFYRERLFLPQSLNEFYRDLDEAAALRMPVSEQLYALDFSHDGSTGVLETVGTDGRRHVFMMSFPAGTRVPVTGPGGGAANGDCQDPALSGDGRYVVFSSKSTNLADDPNGVIEDVFVFDRDAGVFELVSALPGGSSQASTQPAISGDGQAVVFVTRNRAFWGGVGATDDAQIVVRQGDRTFLISRSPDGTPADGACGAPRLSADGRFVVFESRAGNLSTAVAGPGGPFQIYLADRTLGTLRLVSSGVSNAAADGDCRVPAISPNGRHIAFTTVAGNLVEEDTPAGVYQVVSVDTGPVVAPLTLTVGIGQTVPLPIQIRNLDPETGVVRVSELPAAGVLLTAQLVPVQVGIDYAQSSLPLQFQVPEVDDVPVTSFGIQAADADGIGVPSTVTIRIIDPARGYITRLSVTSSGLEGDKASVDSAWGALAVSDDGAVAVFSSLAALSEEDTDIGQVDVYLRRPAIPETRFVNTEAGAFNLAYGCTMSSNGEWIAYYTTPPSEPLQLVRRPVSVPDALPVVIQRYQGAALQAPPALSASGRYTAFAFGGQGYVWDAQSGQSTLVSVNDNGDAADAADCHGISLSDGGTAVAFLSSSANLDAVGARTGDGLYVRFTESGRTRLVSTDGSGTPLPDPRNPSLSMSGRYAAFLAGPAPTLYVKDVGTGACRTVMDGVFDPRLSADGRFITYIRQVDGIWQRYRFDLAPVGGRQGEVLVSTAGAAAGNGDSTFGGQISADGRFVAFPSEADNLLPGGEDGNGVRDAFLSDLGPAVNTLPEPAMADVVQCAEDTTEMFALIVNDAEGNDVVVEVVQPPQLAAEWQVLSPGPGRPHSALVFTPQLNVFGEDSFSYRARDAYGWSAPKTVSIQIQETNDIPAWIGVPQGLEVPEGGELRVDLRPFVNDPDTLNPAPPQDVLTFTANAVGRASDWIAVAPNGYELVLTPGFDLATPAEPAPVYSAELQVTDGRSAPVSAPALLQIAVLHVDRPPVVVSASITPALPRTADALQVDVQGDDPDGDTVDAVEVAWSVDGTPWGEGGDVSVPADQTLKGQTWALAARVRANGKWSEWSTPDSVTIGNTPPTASPAPANGGENDVITVDLSALAGDEDPADTLRFELGEPVADPGTAEIVGTELVYRPAWDALAAGESRDVVIGYRVDDGEAVAESAITVTVAGVNDAPEIALVAPLRLEPGATEGNLGLAGEARAPGVIKVTDPDTPFAELRVILSRSPEKGEVLTAVDTVGDGAELNLDEFPLTYRCDSTQAGVDRFELTPADGLDSGLPVEIPVYLGRLTVTLSLHNGWNAVALPFVPDESSLATLFSADRSRMPLYSGRAWRWDAPRSRFVPAAAAEAGTGYMLFCAGFPAEGAVVIISGVPVQSTERAVGTGWHLLGPLGYTDTTALPDDPGDGNPLLPGQVFGLNPQGHYVPAAELRRGHAVWMYTHGPGFLDLGLE